MASLTTREAFRRLRAAGCHVTRFAAIEALLIATSSALSRVGVVAVALEESHQVRLWNVIEADKVLADEETSGCSTPKVGWTSSRKSFRNFSWSKLLSGSESPLRCPVLASGQAFVPVELGEVGGSGVGLLSHFLELRIRVGVFGVLLGPSVFVTPVAIRVRNSI